MDTNTHLHSKPRDSANTTYSSLHRCIFPLYFIALIVLPLTGSTPATFHNDPFIALKESGRYIEAVSVIEKSFYSTEDPIHLEIAAFRIREIMKYPELYPHGIRALQAMAKLHPVQQNYMLRDRIDTFLAELYLLTGKTKAAQDTARLLSNFSGMIMGPFKNNTIEDFIHTYPPESAFEENQHCAGSLHSVTWVPARQDSLGVIRPTDAYPATTDTFFYLYTPFVVPSDGVYTLNIGKTGYTDLWVDSIKVFSNRRAHGFSHDQYVVTLRLDRGKHRLLMKTGDAPRSGIALSMRLTDNAGNRVPYIRDAPEAPLSKPCQLITSSVFPSLASVSSRKEPDGDAMFHTAYLLYASRIGQGDDAPISRLAAKITSEHPAYSSLMYYVALLEKIPEKKDEYLQASLASNNRNLETLHELARLKSDHGFFQQVHVIIERMSTIDHRSPFRMLTQANLAIRRHWQPEIERMVDELKKSEFPSLGYQLEANSHAKNKDFARALAIYKNQFANDQSITLLENILECYDRSGLYTYAIPIIHQGISIYPGKISLRITLADYNFKIDGPLSSLPYYAAALAVSPHHPELLHKIGTAYLHLGNKTTALHYLERSLASNPDNYSLRRYLYSLKGMPDEIAQYRDHRDVHSLKNIGTPYNDEPAVVLLDETVIYVNADGSFEKKIRKLVQINDRNAIEDFKNNYIIYEPGVETVSEVVCRLIKNDQSIDITEKYRKALSDPDARLYYNLVALVIPVPSLDRDSIIELSYTLRNRGGSGFKNYFSERKNCGGQHRVLKTNILLIHPADKQIYCHLKRIRPEFLKKYNIGSNILYQVVLTDIAPYHKEPSMPPEYDIIPSVSFTSTRSWSDFYEWYRSLLKDKIIVSEEMRQSVARITQSTDIPRERARQIYYHVIKKIRYVGFELGLGGIQPRRSDQTYHSRMGDCKDIAILLVAMFREAGIDARLSLIRTRDRGTDELDIPSITAFNHAICFVNLDGGFFVDGTAKFTGIQELPTDDRDVIVMVIGDNGYQFINTGTSFYLKNELLVTTDVIIAADGSATFSRAMSRNGSIASAMRSTISNKDETLRSLTTYWNSIYPGSSISGLVINSTALDAPVAYSYTCTAPSFARITGNDLVFPSHPVSSGFRHDYGSRKNRNYPVSLGSPITTTSIVRYRIPSGFTIFRVPTNESFTSDDCSAQFTYDYKGNELSATAIIRINNYQVAADSYTSFRSLTRFIEKKELERIILVLSTN